MMGSECARGSTTALHWTGPRRWQAPRPAFPRARAVPGWHRQGLGSMKALSSDTPERPGHCSGRLGLGRWWIRAHGRSAVRSWSWTSRLSPVTGHFLGRVLWEFGCRGSPANRDPEILGVPRPCGDRLTGRSANSPPTGRVAANHVFQKARARRNLLMEAGPNLQICSTTITR